MTLAEAPVPIHQNMQPEYDGPITVGVEWLGPDEATALLALNHQNRKLKRVEIEARGVPSATNLAAAAMIALRLKMNGHLHNGAGYPYPSNEEVLSFIERSPGLTSSLQMADRYRKASLRFPTSLAAGLHFVMSELDPRQADEFWELLYSGAGLFAGHPILTLRNYVIKDLASVKHMDPKYRAAITIKAWNAYRANRSLHSIRWTRSGDKPEDFPTIK